MPKISEPLDAENCEWMWEWENRENERTKRAEREEIERIVCERKMDSDSKYKHCTGVFIYKWMSTLLIIKHVLNSSINTNFLTTSVTNSLTD